MWFIATLLSQYSCLFLALLFIISLTSPYYVCLLTVLRNAKKKKFLLNFWQATHHCSQWIRHLDFPGLVFWQFLFLQTPQKNFLLISRKPRTTSCSSLNWFHGSPTMVLLQEKNRNKNLSQSLLWKSQERRGTDTFLLNWPLLISSCPPKWESWIYLLLHPKNCLQN